MAEEQRYAYLRLDSTKGKHIKGEMVTRLFNASLYIKSCVGCD